ncbi:tetratricopeptide repeat protein [Desulforhopalus sp. IMCC35007]|uniref:tetratricopeptide repeat protein n=1 Tax=Desulforhopalus sp. IMCC35007 TaxID=2569543 RepID=UPI0010AE6A71|nr:tetratricopeptide repeat protein [Desulforhopalus sp. IMCC35007]TKB09145.1 tetratricopeptide repeat protein [Desulforhopalus sp. IMCC35007]
MAPYRIFIFIFLLLTSCSSKPTAISLPEPEEQTDFSCSSFYFLWGTHAEFSERYPEALEAYEKALICDPGASYIKEKIPILMLKMGDYETAATWLTQAIEEEPNNTTYLLFLANIYVQQEKIEEAVVLYEQILAIQPDNEPVNTRLGILYTHLGQYDTAEQIFRQLLEQNPESYFTILSLARLLNQKNEYNEAAELYEKALTLNWSKELAFEIGYLYSSRDEFEKALRIYTTITDNDKFDERALLSRIQTLLDLNRLEEANTSLENIRQFSENPDHIDLIISKVYLQQDRIAEAKEILERLAKLPDSSEASYMLALLAYREQKYTKSLEYADNITADSDNFEEAVYLKVKVLQKLNKQNEAFTLLETNLLSETTSSPLFFALLSTLYQDKKNNEQALTTLRNGIVAYPENHQLHFELGLLLEKNNRTDDAIVEMEKVLELEPDHADALNFIGYSWAEKNTRLEEALSYILRAIALKPDNGFIIDSLGWVYFRMNRFEEAAQALEQAVSLVPNDPHIFDHLGDTYKALGLRENALRAYEKAYELFENKEEKSFIKDKINALGK